MVNLLSNRLTLVAERAPLMGVTLIVDLAGDSLLTANGAADDVCCCRCWLCWWCVLCRMNDTRVAVKSVSVLDGIEVASQV